MKQYKYISQITQSELESNVVVPCLNEDGFPALLIRNAVAKKISNSFSTDNINIKLNAVLWLDDAEHYFHIITAARNDKVFKQYFDVVYEYVFMCISEPLCDTDLTVLIESIDEYFKITPAREVKNLQIGVFGELLCIKQLYDSGYTDITKKYHKNFYSKHDIEISDAIRLEIKTTNTEKRIHRFSHNQISRTDVKVYVASAMVELSQEGVSLYDMFELIISLYSNPESIFALKKLMKKCNVSEENHGFSFAMQHAVDNLKFFEASQLPKINSLIPKGVSGITYDVDCNLSNDIIISDMIQAFDC